MGLRTVGRNQMATDTSDRLHRPDGEDADRTVSYPMYQQFLAGQPHMRTVCLRARARNLVATAGDIASAVISSGTI